MSEVTVRHEVVSDGEKIKIPNQAKEVEYHIENGKLHITWLEPNDMYGEWA